MENKTPKKGQGLLTLLVIALAAGLILAGTAAFTREPIAANSAAGAQASLTAMIPGVTLVDLKPDAQSGVDAGYRAEVSGQAVGYVALATAQGYASPVTVTVGMDTKGAITSISVGGDKFNETAGLGANAKEDAFTSQFKGLSLPVALRQDVDAISGATITSNAVVKAVNAAGEYMKAAAGIKAENLPSNVTVNGKTAVVTEQGYGGPVEITVTVDDSGAITALTVGGSQFNETEGLGARAKEESFTSQFIGKSGQLTLNKDVDAISGATITSTAVVKGVNEGLAALTGSSGGPQVSGNTATVTAQGYGGPIEVTVTVDGSGAITALTVGGSQFNETEGLGARAKEESFTGQFIGKSGQVSLGTDIDAISGATITSTAVVKAVNEALAALSGAPAATPTPAPAAVPTADPNGRTAKAVKDGYESPIEAIVTVDESGKVIGLTLGQNASFGETEGLGTKVRDPAFAGQFIGKTGPFKLGDNIDAVSGATFSSKGAVNAVNAALESLGAIPAAETSAEATQDTTSSASVAETAAPQGTLPEPVVSGNTATVTVQGYGGQVEVTVTVDDKGAITALTVGGAKFSETAGLGAKAKDEAFTGQFIGKSGEVKLGTDIDAISGATITSTAVVKAVNEALKLLPGYVAASAAPTAKEDTTSSASVAATAAPQGSLPEPVVSGNTATVTVQGYGGQVEVTVTVDDKGAITALTVGGAKFNETAGLGAKAKDAAFTGQFIGKSGEVKLGTDVDAISGATITSTAVVKAVNEALKLLAK